MNDLEDNKNHVPPSDHPGEPTPSQSSESPIALKFQLSSPIASRLGARLNPADFVVSSVAAAAAGPDKKVMIEQGAPGKRNPFRVHPSEEYRLYGLPVLFHDQKAYLIDPSLELSAEQEGALRPANIFIIHDNMKRTRLWIFPDSTNMWHVSKFQIAQEAMSTWVRLRNAGTHYESDLLPESSVLHTITPAWPNMSFDEMFDMAFRNFFITRSEDKVLNAAAGLIYG